MSISLRWQILWAPALALVVAALLLSAEVAYRQALAARVSAITEMREELDRALLRLEDRHSRTIRRAHEAVLESRQQDREAILAWTPEHYQKEMERYEAEARAALARVNLPNADARLGADLERIDAQLARIMEQAHAISPVLDDMLAAVSAEDNDAVTAAALELERHDRSMHGILRVAEGIVRRAAIWQMQRAQAEPPPIPRLAWLVLALWVPLSFYIAVRPARRLARLAQAAPMPREATPEAAAVTHKPSSTEERALATRLAALEEARAELERHLEERTREADRAAQTLRRVGQELALFRLYNDNLVNSLHSAVVVTDAAHAVQGINRVARLLLGLSEQVVGTPVFDLALFAANKNLAKGGARTLDLALAARETLRFEGLPVATPHGELLCDLTIAPYLDESGAARGLLWIADDVTEAIQTKSQLLVAERLAAVGRLSAQVAHEIRNPLSAIGLNAELLADDFVGDLPDPQRREAQKLLSAIAAEIERLTEVTEGYLQLARMPRPTQREVDLNHVVGDLVSMLREEMNAHKVEVLLDLATPAPLAWTDPGQLRQALLNVVRNSREAMSNGGTIRIVTSSDPDESVIEISDNGPGIPSEVLPRIFEPFFSTKVMGTGLGLSLTQQIIAEHGGTIRAQSGQGRGATITITLPRRRPDTIEAAEDEEQKVEGAEVA